jgi:hypothetical protein
MNAVVVALLIKDRDTISNPTTKKDWPRLTDWYCTIANYPPGDKNFS